MTFEYLLDYFKPALNFLTLSTIIGYLIKKYLDFRIKKINDKFIEELKWEIKIREQASLVAEYLALAKDLKETDSQEVYRRANQLAWTLTMWLPADIYRAMCKDLIKNTHCETMPILISVRKILLGKKYDALTSDDFIRHAPRIGESRKQ